MPAYMSDPALRKEAVVSLSRILTKGRALGIVVVAFLQDPRKEVLPMRGLFTQTIALRLRSRDEVTMVLGDGIADSAPAHRISPDAPGSGYVIAEDGQVTRVRADFWTDDQIHSTAKQYGRTASTTGERQRND
jgi:S-DNA-T family DNA segregation ATPase FtsK/SpoIIIE